MRLTEVSFWLSVNVLLFIPDATALGTPASNDECISKPNLFEQISCYAAAAKTNNDLAGCDQASHEGVRYQCYAIFAEYSASPDICHKIPPATEDHRLLIDGCLSDVAMKARKPGICKRIDALGIRDSCYLKLSKEINDPSLCMNILDAGLKSACTGETVIVE